MNQKRYIKVIAWCALIIVIVAIAVTFRMRPVWWAYSDMFFAFMAVFCNLMRIYIGIFNPYAARTLLNLCMVFGALTVLAIVGEYIAFQYISM